MVEVLSWLGQGKWLITKVTAAAAVASLVISLLTAPIFTARTSMLPPGNQQQSGSAAALAALGSLGGLAGGFSGTKTTDELYVALMRSDTVLRALDSRFKLQVHYKVETFVALRKVALKRVRIASDKKTGVISVEVDDPKAAFAAELANGYVAELSGVLSRLAVSEAQQRRAFFESQLAAVNEKLALAETRMRELQERSGMIVLDKQSEAIISGAARVKSLIAEREVTLRVLRTTVTDQNYDVRRIESELKGWRAELARLESAQGVGSRNGLDMPVGKIPAAAIDNVRARRELKLQELLLESVVRQLEMARLDEAKEGPLLQSIDQAVPPDFKSKPSRAMIAVGGTLTGLLGVVVFVLVRAFLAKQRQSDPDAAQEVERMRQAWRWRQQKPAG